MSVHIKVRKIGNSLGVVLPKEALAKLRVNKDDELHLVETQDGYHIQRFDPAFEEDLEIIDDLMSRYKNAMRELAK